MSQPGTAEQFDFGRALRVLKDGGCVTRGGWNGAHMCLVLIPGSHFEVSAGRPLAVHLPVGTPVDYRAHIDMLTADGSLVPWLASQSDVLAEDWQEANLALRYGIIRGEQARTRAQLPPVFTPEPGQEAS